MIVELQVQDEMITSLEKNGEMSTELLIEVQVPTVVLITRIADIRFIK